jgi:hypothetical protein
LLEESCEKLGVTRQFGANVFRRAEVIEPSPSQVEERVGVAAAVQEIAGRVIEIGLDDESSVISVTRFG